MNDDLMNDLAQLTRYAGALQTIVGTAVDQAPQRSEGTDPRRAVTVTVDGEGLPQRIAVLPDWSRKVPAAELGEAVAAAFQVAVQDRMTGWTASLKSSGWAADFAELKDDLSALPVDLPQQAVPSRAVPPPADVSSRPVDVLFEDVLSAMDEAETVADTRTAAPASEAEVARGKLVLRLTADGALSAVVDPGWAERQSAASLMTHFDQALGIVRLKASRAKERPAVSTRLDSLLGEAMALLSRS